MNKPQIIQSERIENLTNQLDIHKQALKLACEMIKDQMNGHVCPADFITFEGDCTECSGKDETDCWMEHYLSRARKGDK